MRSFLFPATITLILLTCYGCAALSDWYSRAMTPQLDGSVPAANIASDIPTLIGNPANVRAWQDLIETLLYIAGVGGAAAGGTILVKRRVRQRRENAQLNKSEVPDLWASVQSRPRKEETCDEVHVPAVRDDLGSQKPNPPEATGPAAAPGSAECS